MPVGKHIHTLNYNTGSSFAKANVTDNLTSSKASVDFTTQLKIKVLQKHVFFSYANSILLAVFRNRSN